MIRPTLLLTRPRPSAQAFLALLQVGALARVRVVISPVMKIIALGDAPHIGQGNGVIFTSANGVLHAPMGERRKAYCVGASTTDQARMRGWDAQMAGENAQELIEMLKAQPPSAPLLHLAGVHTRGNIAEKLSVNGIQVQHKAVYDQVLTSLSDAARAALKGPCIVPVFSARSAQQLADQAAGQLGLAQLITLSDAVATPLRGERAANLTVLPAPRMQYMCKEVEKLCLAFSLP